MKFDFFRSLPSEATDTASATGAEPAARSRRYGMTALLVTATLFAGVLASVAFLTEPGATATASTVTTQDACGAPAPGQYSCLAIRRTDIAALVAGTTATPAGYGPANLQSAYKLPSATGGGGQTVAIIDAYDDPNLEADLGVYRAEFGLPVCTTANGCFHKVNQLGAPSPLPIGNTGWAGEESLDVDQVSAVCPNCHILMVEANTPSQDLYTAVNTAVRLGAGYVSMSFGGSESPSDLSTDAQYLDHPGVVLTASTGDGGYGVSYPAASPDVIAVGGTSLTAATNSRGWTETAWRGAGSGCSAYAPAPAYQHGLSSCGNRVDADLSAVADPATGVAVYQTYGAGGWTVYGGTSVSSPLIASAYALAGARPTTDNPGADLYSHAASLNDVTIGSNNIGGNCTVTVLCTAGPGWDGPTGLGTPNGIGALQPGGGTTPPAPVVSITNPGSQSTAVNSVVTLPVHAVDSAGLALGYAASGLPAGLSISSTTGLITGTPTAVGQSGVTLTVVDAKGASAAATFTWAITSPVSPPPTNTVTVSNPGSQSTVVKAAARLQITGTDSAGAVLSYRASGLPTGLTINPSSGLISGTPAATGSNQVTVTASDATGASGSASFAWTIRSGTTPPPPPTYKVTITNPGNQSTLLNSGVSLQIQATDSAGGALTYRASGLPAGLSLNAGRGLISGQGTSAGSSPVTVTATDAAGAYASATFTWTVTAPSVINVYLPNQNSRIGLGLTLQVQATDSSGRAMSYRAVNLPAGLTLNATTGLITGTPTQNGTWPVRVYASDATGASSVASLSWSTF